MKEKLIELKACKEAREWAGDKSWKEIYETCHRGEWLLWLFNKTNPSDLQLLTLAKGHCVNTVRHLMKDDVSVNAVDVAIAFGEGKATKRELDDAVDAAYVAYAADADDAAAYAAAAAADADAYVAAADAYAATAYAAAFAADAYAAAAAAAEDAAARIKNQLNTADICRKYLPIEVWNLNN